jgi:hypothetical protein
MESNRMNQKRKMLFRAVLAVTSLVTLIQNASAQYFTANKGDLLLGVRKTSGGAGELVVNIGNVTNFVAIAPGVTVNVSNFTPAQLTAVFPTYGILQWSVFGAFQGSSAWAGFPSSTLWYTLPRSATNVQSSPVARAFSGAQQQTRNAILQIGSGAAFISSSLGSTNSTNNLVLVREPSGDQLSGLTAGINDPSISSLGNFQGTWVNVENVTPAIFTASQRSDLYQSLPDGSMDPNSHLTTGNAYYVGYFTFNPDGTMTFTRASSVAPAPTITLQRSGNVSTISFATASGFSYSLYYTNSANLTAPISNWGTPGTNVTGNGSTKSFTDTTTAPDRVYSVKAQ